MADPGGANPAHLTLPDNQAALAPFPPGCPVLVSGSSDEPSAAHASPQTYLGQIHSVYIDLGSTTRDNFYRVRPSSASATEAATELRSASESALKYAPGCTVTVNASALPPFVTEGGGGDTRDATIISCVGGGGSSNYYLLEVMPGPSDSWTNIQSTVPVDSVRYRAPVVEDNELGQDGDQNNRAINNNPHPHMIPADEDGSLKSTSKDPPVASIAFDNTGSRKRPAQLDADDGGSSTLSPMPTDGSISVASSSAIAEDVVRRIDIPDTVDASKVEGALIGPDNKINRRMQTKFGVIISILGLDDAMSSSAVESFSKLGPISYKVGDKCIMIQGSERKVHDAAKVVIHMLVNKCYDGNDKDTLMRKLRVVRQVRKKVEPSPSRASARSNLASPMKKLKTGPAVAEGDAAPLAAATKDPVERGWSPPIEEDPQPQIGSAGSAREQLRGLVRDPIWVEKDGSSHWQCDVISPLPETDLFERIVGDGGENKKRLEHNFSRVFFSIRGKGIRLKTGRQSEGPLRVEVGGNNKEDVSLAAQHIAEIIDTNPVEDRVQTDSASRPLSRPSKHSQDPEAHHDHTAKLLHDAKAVQDTQPKPSNQSRNTENNYSEPKKIGPAADRARQSKGLVMYGPVLEGGKWVVKIRSPHPIGDSDLFGLLVCRGGMAREILARRFNLNRIFIIKENESMPLHVAINGRERASTLAAAEYVAKTLHEMSMPVPSKAPERIFEKCYWDGNRWVLHLRLPCTEKAAADIIIGPGGRKNAELSRKLNCVIRIEGGEMEKYPDLRQYPAHVSIRDYSRITVEEAGNYISKILREAAVRPNAHNGPRPQSRATHAAAAGHNPQNFQQHRQQERQYWHKHQGPHSHHDSSHNPFNAGPAQRAGFGENAFWTTTLWPPVEQYPYFDFYNHIVGPRGSTQERIEHRFGVEIKVLGQQGNNREPLHVVVNGRTSRDVDAAASHIVEMLTSFARG